MTIFRSMIVLLLYLRLSGSLAVTQDTTVIDDESKQIFIVGIKL